MGVWGGVAGGPASPALEATAAPFHGVARRVPFRGVGASAPGRNDGLEVPLRPSQAQGASPLIRQDMDPGCGSRLGCGRGPDPSLCFWARPTVRSRRPAGRSDAAKRPERTVGLAAADQVLLPVRGRYRRQAVPDRRTTLPCKDGHRGRAGCPIKSISTLPDLYAVAGERRYGSLPSPVRRPAL